MSSWKSFTWTTQNKKIFFPNPLGIAGGVDKDATSTLDWQNLNCGFVEIGTVTPLPQDSNPGKIMDRDLDTKSLWNKMGFPSIGANAVYKNILILKQSGQLQIPLFINIGKNRTTSNEKAHLDYNSLLTHFQNVADAFVINISSPNTKGLRDIIKPENLGPFLSLITQHHQSLDSKPPLLIKLSPDIEASDFDQAIKLCLKYSIDGFILTNTTLSREKTPFYPSEGGVSGLPLQKLSLNALERTFKLCSQEKFKKIIISTGGVMTAANVFERIEAGADLVQVYSTLIFEGPLFFRKVADVAKQKYHTS